LSHIEKEAGYKPITKNNYPKGEEIPGLTPGLAHAVMFFTNSRLRPVSDTTILVG